MSKQGKKERRRQAELQQVAVHNELHVQKGMPLLVRGCKFCDMVLESIITQVSFDILDRAPA